RQWGLDALYCSPFLRSLETARPIAEAARVAARIRADLFEQGGCYSGYEIDKRRGEPGRGRKQLMQEYPGWEIDATIGDHGWWGREYESVEEAAERAARVARWLSD